MQQYFLEPKPCMYGADDLWRFEDAEAEQAFYEHELDCGMGHAPVDVVDFISAHARAEG